jgi:hypothetical protein
MTTKDQSDGARPPKKSKGIPLTKELQAHIGGKLRAAYGQLVQEPVPDRFADLLKQLADAEAAQKTSTATDKEPNS